MYIAAALYITVLYWIDDDESGRGNNKMGKKLCFIIQKFVKRIPNSVYCLDFEVRRKERQRKSFPISKTLCRWAS